MLYWLRGRRALKRRLQTLIESETSMDIGNWQAADVRANGLKMHYYRTGGRGRSCVVPRHHGQRPVLAPLARTEAEYDVVMPDGAAWAVSDGNDYTPESHAADAAAFIAALGLERPVIGGHSMGGLTATLVAAPPRSGAGRHPGRPGLVGPRRRR